MPDCFMILRLRAGAATVMAATIPDIKQPTKQKNQLSVESLRWRMSYVSNTNVHSCVHSMNIIIIILSLIIILFISCFKLYNQACPYFMIKIAIKDPLSSCIQESLIIMLTYLQDQINKGKQQQIQDLHMEASESTGLIHRPKTKFDLIDKVGSKGKYQLMLLIIFCGVWGVTGMALLGTPFYFLDDKFQCKQKGLLGDDCDTMVCSLPEQQWTEYIDHTDSDIDTIPTQFGPYYCDNAIYVDLASSAVYVGALIGYLLFSFYADNFGRRITMILAWGIATIGTLVLLFSQNLIMVAVGFFMLGAGADAAVNMCFNFLGEVVENQTRQKYSVILQPWFAIGACLVTTSFIFIHNWKLVILILVVIPSVVIMFFVVLYIEETPQFLIRQGVEKTLKSLNRIGKINKGIKNILVEADIINVINEQVEDQQFNKMITPADLCRFSSLRLTTICLCYLSFAVYALYYGPVLVIDKIGFNMFVSSYVVQFSQLIVYIPLYLVVDKIPRQKAGVILFSITGTCAALLLFINKPEDCDFCVQAILQLGIVAFFRSSSALYFILMYIYMVQLYPARSRAMGGGIASSVGTLASSLSPIVLGIFDRNDQNPNILFAILSLLSIGVVTLLPQTKGLPLQQQIYEIEMAKNQIRKSGYQAYQSKYSEYKSDTKSEFMPVGSHFRDKVDAKSDYQ